MHDSDSAVNIMLRLTLAHNNIPKYIRCAPDHDLI